MDKFYPGWKLVDDLLISCIIVILDVLILVLPIKAINRYTPFVTGRGYRLWG